MVALRTLMMLVGALAVLMLGAVAAPATAEAAPPPCHEMAGHHQGSEGAPPTSEPEKPMRAMACCVACVAAPAIQPPGRAAPPAPHALPSARPAALPVGQTLTPEPGPPRLTA